MRLVLVVFEVAFREACGVVVLGLVRKALHSRTHQAASAEVMAVATRTSASRASVFNLGLGSPGRGCLTGSVWLSSPS
jgi:hypothetical protein